MPRLPRQLGPTHDKKNIRFDYACQRRAVIPDLSGQCIKRMYQVSHAPGANRIAPYEFN